MMMLVSLGERKGREDLHQAGSDIDAAIDATLANPASRTMDLGGTLGTKAFGNRIAESL